MVTIGDLIQALESGKYKKGFNGLISRNAEGDLVWCCLGVACELKYGPEIRETLIESHAGLPEEVDLSLKEIFPHEIYYDGDSDYCGDLDMETFLAAMNDSHEGWDLVLSILKDYQAGRRFFVQEEGYYF